MKITITKPELLHAVSLNCDTDSNHPRLHGVLFEACADGGVLMAASDGRQMAVGYDENAEMFGDRNRVIVTIPPRARPLLKAAQPVEWSDGFWQFQPGWKAPGELITYEPFNWRDAIRPLAQGELSPGLQGAVCPARLASFAKAAKILGHKPQGFMKIFSHSASKAQMIVMRWRDDYRGFLMPARWEDVPALPEWLTEKENDQ